MRKRKLRKQGGSRSINAPALGVSKNNIKTQWISQSMHAKALGSPATRCRHPMNICKEAVPEWKKAEANHFVCVSLILK